jgi:hypothetical protein
MFLQRLSHLLLLLSGGGFELVATSSPGPAPYEEIRPRRYETPGVRMNHRPRHGTARTGCRWLYHLHSTHVRRYSSRCANFFFSRIAERGLVGTKGLAFDKLGRYKCGDLCTKPGRRLGRGFVYSAAVFCFSKPNTHPVLNHKIFTNSP